MATGRIPPSLSIYSGEDYNVISFEELLMSAMLAQAGVVNTTKHTMDQLDDYCERKCNAIDCNSVVYIPKKLTTTTSGNKPVLAVVAPQHPIIRATSQPAVTLVQCLTDIASSVGFWLGISAFGLFESLKKFIRLLLGSSSKKKDTRDKKPKAKSVSNNLLLALSTSVEKKKRYNRMSPKTTSPTPSVTSSIQRVHYRDRHQALLGTSPAYEYPFQKKPLLYTMY